MALKMIGSKLVPVDPGVTVVTRELDVNALNNTVTRLIEKTIGSALVQVEEKIILAPKVVIGPVVPFPRNLSDGTIIPLFDEAVPVRTIPMERVAAFVPDSGYSPAPASIFGIGPGLGTIMVMLGKVVVAEIAADVSMDTMQRIGQRVMKNARIRGRVIGSNYGKHVTVRDDSDWSPYFKFDKRYTGPCDWWEFWCWLF